MPTNHFSLKKMCPPGRIKFCFTINGVQIVSKKISFLNNLDTPIPVFYIKKKFILGFLN